MKELIFDYIQGIILETNSILARKIMNEKKQEYQDKNAVFGRDFIHGIKIWFIYDIDQPRNLSHSTLEIAVEDYLLKNNQK